jgi:hypothetical protein
LLLVVLQIVMMRMMMRMMTEWVGDTLTCLIILQAANCCLLLLLWRLLHLFLVTAVVRPRVFLAVIFHTSWSRSWRGTE